MRASDLNVVVTWNECAAESLLCKRSLPIKKFHCTKKLTFSIILCRLTLNQKFAEK